MTSDGPMVLVGKNEWEVISWGFIFHPEGPPEGAFFPPEKSKGIRGPIVGQN